MTVTVRKERIVLMSTAFQDIRADTLRRLLAKVDEFSESHRAFGLPDDLLHILKDDLVGQGEPLIEAR